MRDHLAFYLNGKRHTADGAAAFSTLTDFLRETLGHTGTKVVCAEGDCGACSVLVGRPSCDGSQLVYRTIDACIGFMYQFDRAHLVTIEGLKNQDGTLSPVQDVMVQGHGSQCGFCTPGFVVTMQGLFEDEPAPKPCEGSNGHEGCSALSEEQLRLGLSGNLCRCTGYQQILDAGKAIDPAGVDTMNRRYDSSPMIEDFARLGDESVLIEARQYGETRRVFLPRTLEEAATFRAANPGCKVASGTTDLGVQHNHASPGPGQYPAAILSMTQIDGLDAVTLDHGVLTCGASATWGAIEHAVQDAVPEYHRILTLFGSPQVRNAGTIAGNLANASPIADSIPFHMVMDAELDLVSSRGKRSVKLNDFYLGYKQLDLADDELIAAVRTPLPTPGQRLKLFKVSKRRDMDISTFTAAVLLTFDETGDTLVAARLAYGGVGPTVLRLPETEAYLAGQPFTEDTMRQAGQLARTEITPLSDVRGSADFRLQLAENILVKCYHELSPPTPQPA
ncbi:xanthine dehydrogenase small subunit [Algisphaera agarilytica]|uniref:Xanthine dehydrogenase small subunit n=1 Tax=Algisphaera agarilytica TaxID=1385975 RepID=A0A7X0LK83_9BACT|nr:FAD binding domain-containing protein [Algisphaera agarilytica]MBB6429569.1 xanthine dehydrogenase small subunit [Algisphaera agarilytica]